MKKKDTPEIKRRKLVEKEHRTNPLGTLKDAANQSKSGDFRSGSAKTTLVIIIILLIITYFLIKNN
ncbi:DUF6366 family protein [Vagococcus elongatus]|uniref:Uncharacterized protein n=1 Tax=Vagococcus elongatus TaxID=180344 RepID=A0A430ASK8_9ENTE|nr:DUF6366 family protein [Vagococcus elongatus]RSU11047.1 hypothetical protein CBF29_08785 [Vagococcus elongatus]